MPLVNAVRAELSVPLRLATRVVGVLNVESTTPIGDEPSREIERTAALLCRRLAELGSLDSATPGQRLARAAARAAQMEDADAVIREAAAAGLEVAGMESIMVALNDADGQAHIHHAAGPLAEVFPSSTPTRSRRWRAGSSRATSLTMGDPAGKSLPCTEPLRRAGAGALVVVPLAVGRARLGFMAVADRSNVVLDTEQTELMELLGVQTAAQLRGLAPWSSCATGRRATRSPASITRRPSAPSCPSGAAAAAAAGRQLAVVLADVDGVGAVNDRSGHSAGDEVLREMAAMLADVSPEDSSAFRLGGDEFALVLEIDDRGSAQEVAWQLQAQARERLGTTLSIGVAVAGEDEPTAICSSAPTSALIEVKRRGRDGVALATPRLSD